MVNEIYIMVWVTWFVGLVSGIAITKIFTFVSKIGKTLIVGIDNRTNEIEIRRLKAVSGVFPWGHPKNPNSVAITGNKHFSYSESPRGRGAFLADIEKGVVIRPLVKEEGDAESAYPGGRYLLDALFSIRERNIARSRQEGWKAQLASLAVPLMILCVLGIGIILFVLVKASKA